MSGHLTRAVVAEVGLLRAAPCIRVVQPQCRALAFAHLSTTLVANENGLSSHRNCLLKSVNGEEGAYRNGGGNSRGNPRPANSPRTQQSEQRALLPIEPFGSRTDDTQMPWAKVVDRSSVQILLDDGRADV